MKVSDFLRARMNIDSRIIKCDVILTHKELGGKRIYDLEITEIAFSLYFYDCRKQRFEGVFLKRNKFGEHIAYYDTGGMIAYPVLKALKECIGK